MALTPAGQTQAKKAGQAAKKQGLAFDVIISSPLTRTCHTARHVATELGYPHDAIELRDSLIERKFGTLEGRKDLVARTKYLLDESAIDTYEGVESLAALQKRADDTLQHLHSLPQDTILIVGHGAFGRALRRAINKEPLRHRGTSYANAEIVRLI